MELVRLCVNVNAKRDSQQLLTSSGSGKEMFSSQRKERIFIDFDVNYFWQWTDFQSYVEAVASFLAGGSLLMYFMLKVEPFVEMVGFAAVFTEALLGTPQFYRNFKNKVILILFYCLNVVCCRLAPSNLSDPFHTLFFLTYCSQPMG